MQNSLYFIVAFTMLMGCGERDGLHPRELFPNKEYNYVQVDRSSFSVREQYYVPVYSSIYGASGSSLYHLAATLSIRNIGYTDSIYISKVFYYGSKGELLKKYVDSVIYLPPMASLEMVVEASEKEGGAGANFVVEWMGNNIINKPLIQTVMTSNDLRIAFTADAVKINEQPSASDTTLRNTKYELRSTK